MSTQVLRRTLLPRLLEARRRTGLSQDGYADLIGVSRRTVYRWEAGARTPDLVTLARIAHYSGVSVTWLIYDVDEQRSVIAEGA